MSEFKRLVGSLVLPKVDCELNGKVEELADMMINDTWLHRNRNRVPGRMVTIRSGLQLCQESIETPVGVVSVQFEIIDGKLAAYPFLGNRVGAFLKNSPDSSRLLRESPQRKSGQQCQSSFPPSWTSFPEISHHGL